MNFIAIGTIISCHTGSCITKVITWAPRIAAEVCVTKLGRRCSLYVTDYRNSEEIDEDQLVLGMRQGLYLCRGLWSPQSMNERILLERDEAEEPCLRESVYLTSFDIPPSKVVASPADASSEIMPFIAAFQVENIQCLSWLY